MNNLKKTNSITCYLSSRFLIPVFIFFAPLSLLSQEENDTLIILSEVTVRAFEQNREASLSGVSVKVIEANNADRYNKTSLVGGFNTVAGVRMEERSPASYRINIRGSSLRSPFGVRNVKVYWNDIPVTDAGGNTYFNQFAWNNFNTIEIVKGPVSSMYGAGTGGLILMNSQNQWQPGVSLDYVAGSYNLHNILASARFGTAANSNQVTYAHTQSDGYRVQTNMRRDNFSWQSKIKLSSQQQLSALLLFSDLYYQTPGALTLSEWQANPKAARPAAGPFPSAVDAKAAIYQKNVMAGFSNEYFFTSEFRNTTSLYGSFAQIKNPAVRNYERRNEPGFGGRTVFAWEKEQDRNSTGGLQLVGGAEFQQGYFNTQVSANSNGNPGTLQTDDDVDFTAFNVFAQGDWYAKEKWFVSAGLSLNWTEVSITRLNIVPVVEQRRSYPSELAPRISIKRKFRDDWFVSATIAKGFSPPTVAEVLPSTGVISTNLEAEHGWNFESSGRIFLLRKKLMFEVTAFYFKLENALVQRRDGSGADYFINAGDTKQKGIEAHADYTIHSRNGFLDYIMLTSDYTYNHFRYGDFVKGTDDFSGKTIPSVPAHTVSGIADIHLKNGLYSNATYYHASSIYLNDANTAIAEPYHLLGWRLGWKRTMQKKYRFNFYVGADNLLDEQYSLGNDINAAGGRYYNAAPARNYYAGISFQWIKPVSSNKVITQ